MSFQTGLSGLNAASRSLDVIGNNIANANTTGMKASRAEFGNLVASSISVGGANMAGIGVEVATTSQQFSQGNINITGNDLDVAINGGGFFQLRTTDGSAAYTRDGSFKLDKVGNIVTNSGAKLMGYPTDVTGKPTSATIGALQLPTTAPIGANVTSAITASFNLDARAPLAVGSPAVAAVTGPPAVAAIAAVPATPRSTYGTALTVYDTQGAPVPVSLYFEKKTSAAAGDTWEVFNTLDASVTTPLFTMTFDKDGTLTAPLTSPTLTIATPSAVTPDISATLDISKVTQYGAAFAVADLTQDGYPPGELTGMKISADGVIMARYSNGETQAAGQLALADFRNVQGLSPIGGNNWVESYTSGPAVQGSPGLGKFGALRAGALEESNVDLTAELVNMMTAQRAYQANAQTIKTQDQVMSTLVNLR